MQPVPPRTVLIVARDPVIGALMGELTTLCGHPAVYPRADERPLHALDRLSPGLILIDADDSDGTAPDFLAGARASGPVIFFSGGMNERELARFASQFDALSFPLPNGPRRLSETLERAATG